MNESYEKAYAQALRFLGPRFLSVYELENKLKRKEYTSEVIQKVIQTLIELDYINDERLSYQVLHHYMEEGRYGKQYIYQKMKKRGLSVPNEINEYDEYATALRFLERYFPQEKGPYERDKVLRKLYNRGFSRHIIVTVYDDVFA